MFQGQGNLYKNSEAQGECDGKTTVWRCVEIRMKMQISSPFYLWTDGRVVFE